MLRHIVMWKLSGETPEEREAQAAEVVPALAGLEHSVPTVRSFSVHRDEIQDGTNWDIGIVADFDDLDGLQEYIVHPSHVAVVDVIRRNTSARAGIDATF